jgi:radical SAM-linked protein
MQLDPSLSPEALSGDRDPGAPADKMRLRFRKDGLLRLVSHHDLMHVFERLFRRAAIPFRSTQGFHPQPRIVFALSLALGVVGCEEVAEVELDRPLDPDELQHRLQQHSPPGLAILSVRRIAPRTRAQVARVRYRLALPSDRLVTLPPRVTELLQCPHLWIERTRPRSRRLDLRPFLHDLRLGNDHLEMALWVSGSAGTARPEEILQALGLADLLDAGAVLERSKLELRDELPETEAGPPGLVQDGPQPAVSGTLAPADRGHRPAPLLPGPLSFDS